MEYKEIIKKFKILYPNGFEDEKWKEGEKKYKVEKINSFVDNNISKKIFENYINTNQTGKIIELIEKIISLSSVVSVFEKIAFRNFINEANNKIIDSFAILLNNMLYGKDFEENFDSFSDFLVSNKYLGKNTNIAKWTLVTSILAHIKRNEEVLIKPNTAKYISKILQKPFYYISVPNIITYNDYKKIVMEFKNELEKDFMPRDNMIVQAVLYICCGSQFK